MSYFQRIGGRSHPSMDERRILALVTDAYGGHGGIARFNRELLDALVSDPKNREVVVFPRLAPVTIGEEIPAKVAFKNRGTTTKLGFVKHVLSWLKGGGCFDLLVCGHINLLPLAWLVGKWHRRSVLLIIHGIDAWSPTKSRLTNFLASRVDGVVGVSCISIQRFRNWSGLSEDRCHVLPNCVDLSAFSPGPRNQVLVERYGLEGKRVLMTLGRMPGPDRYKGYDEILDVMPQLLREMPNLVYLLAGDGPDRPRLADKARELGVADHVIFAGMIAEEEKADHYRLADAYVMPSRGEGFGIVLLEAMACGVPTMASKVDGSREAMRDGALGVLVDPSNPEEIISGVKQCLSRSRGVPDGLEYYSQASYRGRVHDLIENCL